MFLGGQNLFWGGQNPEKNFALRAIKNKNVLRAGVSEHIKKVPPPEPNPVYAPEHKDRNTRSSHPDLFLTAYRIALH